MGNKRCEYQDRSLGSAAHCLSSNMKLDSNMLKKNKDLGGGDC
jgi:hypothetical protein